VLGDLQYAKVQFLRHCIQRSNVKWGLLLWQYAEFGFYIESRQRRRQRRQLRAVRGRAYSAWCVWYYAEQHSGSLRKSILRKAGIFHGKLVEMKKITIEGH
jgi:hypothetical protein